MRSFQFFIGTRLKRDIFNKAGTLLLQQGTVLNEEFLQKIVDNKISITEDDVIIPADDQQEQQVELLMDEASEEMERIFHEIRYSRKVPVIDVRNKIIPSIQKVTEDPDLFRLLATLQSKDDYTYRHNIGVGVIATLIGKWMKMDSKNLSLLALAATLHDVGKMKISLEILNKPGKLTKSEYQVIQKHTIYGYELLTVTVGISARVAQVALQHHEREDGGGYPYGITGDEMDLFSKIVAVADVFHAMTSKRPYHEERPFYQVIKEMENDQFGKLDPYIVKVLLRHIMDAMVGSEVVLTDGRKGKIILTQPHDLIRPLIVVGEEFIDLSKAGSINIEKVNSAFSC